MDPGFARHGEGGAHQVVEDVEVLLDDVAALVIQVLDLGDDVEEVAAAVVHMAGLPLSTNVLSMTIMATKMPFVGRG